MIIYNVTVNIDESVHDKWLQWMRNKHIDDVLSTGLFISARMVKVLVEEEMGGTTYSVQYFTDSRAKLEEYYKHFLHLIVFLGERVWHLPYLQYMEFPTH